MSLFIVHLLLFSIFSFFFFFNDTATTEIYTLSLHDALPICDAHGGLLLHQDRPPHHAQWHVLAGQHPPRSEEHTSELQSQSNLVCRLLLEKKKKKKNKTKQTKKLISTTYTK